MKENALFEMIPAWNGRLHRKNDFMPPNASPYAGSGAAATRPRGMPLLAPRGRRRRKAQTTLEFSLILLPFFAILFAIIDYAQIYYYDNALQNGLREAARFATAGRVIQNGTNYDVTNGVSVPQAISDGNSREASRNECIRYWFQSNCVLAIPLTNIMIYSASVPSGQPPVVTTNNGVLHLVASITQTTNGSTVTTNVTSPVVGPGGANDYVEIIATFHINTITPIFSFLGGYNGRAVAGGYPVRVSAIVKNEPAYLNFQHVAIYPGEPTNSQVQ